MQKPWVMLRNLITFLVLLLANSLTLNQSFAGGGVDPVVLDRMEAYVNTSPILNSDLDTYRRTLGLRAKIDPLFQNSPLSIKGKDASNSEIIDAMINDRIVQKEFPKSDAEVEQEITTIQTNNRIDRNTLRDALKSEGFSFSDYFEMIRESSSKKELINREIQTKVNVSDDDIKNYYFNHMAKGDAAVRTFSLHLISISPKNYKTPAAAQRIAQDTLKEIQKGESFEEVAKRVSDDTTASSGGDLGAVSEDLLTKEIRDQAKTLKIGEVSRIFEDKKTGRQLIIKLDDVKSADSEQFEKVKDEIRGQLFAKEYEQQVKLWEERKRQSAVVHISGSPTIHPIAPNP